MTDPFKKLPKPPYYAVIFIAQNTGNDPEEYAEMAGKLFEMAEEQPGFLSYEDVAGEDNIGMNVSYWKDEESIKNWKKLAYHLTAQKLGKEKWYQWFHIRVAKVERAYSFKRKD